MADTTGGSVRDRSEAELAEGNDGDDGWSGSGVRSEDTVVPVAVHPWRRDEGTARSVVGDALQEPDYDFAWQKFARWRAGAPRGEIAA